MLITLINRGDFFLAIEVGIANIYAQMFYEYSSISQHLSKQFYIHLDMKTHTLLCDCYYIK